jgi:hypothetical protein
MAKKEKDLTCFCSKFRGMWESFWPVVKNAGPKNFHRQPAAAAVKKKSLAARYRISGCGRKTPATVTNALWSYSSTDSL